MQIRSILLILIGLVTLSISIQPRDKAIQFSGIAVMPDLQFKTIKLNDYAGKYLILVFYPFDFTYVCPTQIISFSNSVDDFKKINTQILAISVDSHFSHQAWRNTPRIKGGLGQIKYPLLSDLTKQISSNYGMLVDKRQDPLYSVSHRGLVIIDDKHIVRSVLINDEQVGRSVNQTYRLVQAFQHADKHGVVCPANWTPGEKTITPDSEKKLQYFKDEEL